jgi:ribonuclease G
VSRTLFVAVSPGEIWAALAEDGALEALRVVRTGAPSQVGAVFLGRIVALRPELPAALVDIGLDRPGFLDARDADKRNGIAGLTEGQALVVAVIKDARADKAAGLRIIRATGEQAARIEEASRAAKPPARLEAPQPVLAAMLTPFLKPAPDQIVIDDRGAFAEARSFLLQRHPELAPRLALHAETTPLFEHAGLAGAIDEVLSPRVALASGGALIIEPTNAATFIDVDGSKAAALATNLEAARALARQIILRNLAGPLVVDFVGMKKRQDRDKVLAALRSALAVDHEKPEILGWTRLGHVELVRRRRVPPLADLLNERAPEGHWRKTALTVALEALRAAAREADARAGKALTVAAHPDIVAALSEGEGLAARQVLEARLGQALVLDAQPQRQRDSVDIRPR